MESPLRIKRSLGIARGKNDRIDAIRIAEYAHKNISVLKMYEAPRDCIHYLQKLTAIRNRLIKTRTILTNEVKVNNYFLSKQQCWDIGLTFSRSVSAIKEDIISVDLQIDTLISSDTTLKRMFELITSVPCIGKVIAVQIIIHTNEFKKITTARQFACYCGVAPFEKSSGGVTFGRSRISFLANKELKANLHLAAMGWLRRPKSFLREYYLKKQSEGKNNMVILNAVRNKLIHRIYSCVNHDVLYSENL
ncbi:transposase [Dyadobacter bucti]|uniref:transposase n=1 Tax=Dyadobacter bucti TaxID=2572203 RepID=UPI00140BE0B4|nr:transposase [Dyadobacter bucti]